MVPRHRGFRRTPPRNNRWGAARDAAAVPVPAMSRRLTVTLDLRDRVFREDLLDPLERLRCGRLWCHPALHDLGPTHWPDMFALHLRIGRIECPVIRDRR